MTKEYVFPDPIELFVWGFAVLFALTFWGYFIAPYIPPTPPVTVSMPWALSTMAFIITLIISILVFTPTWVQEVLWEVVDFLKELRS